MNSKDCPKMTQAQNEVLEKYSSNIVRRGLLLALKIESSYIKTSSSQSNSSILQEVESIETLFLQGITLYKQGNSEKSLVFFNRILEIDPKYIDALCFRGFALDSLERTQEGVRDFTEVLKLNSKDECAHILYAQGAAYSLLGKPIDAKQRFLKTLKAKIRPSSILTAWDLYFRACAQYLFFSNKQFALQNCEQASLVDPENLLNLVLQGSILIELGNYERAIEILTKAIIGNPLHVKADITFYSRGLAYYHLNDFDGAAGDFSCSLALNPKNARSYLYRALAYAGLKDFVQAEEDVDKGLEIDPDLYNTNIKFLDASFAYTTKTRQIMSSLFVDTGDVHYELENYQYAIEDYSYAINLDPNNDEADISRNLALAMLQLNNDEDAEMTINSITLEKYQSSFLSFLYSMAQFSRTVDRISKLDSETAAEMRESFSSGFSATT